MSEFLPESTPDRLLTEAEAATFLNVATSWLAEARRQGRGLPHVMFGRYPRYRREDLLAWIEANKAGGGVLS
jgi:excisionase family DNA binding protein